MWMGFKHRKYRRNGFMRIAIVAFDGFNEIDSFVAFNILNCVKSDHWKVALVDAIESIFIHSAHRFSHE